MGQGNALVTTTRGACGGQQAVALAIVPIAP
jgi:hypothetical protein